MLRKLTVSNLAIVEKAEAEFAPGLTVITGETGAGKSVLMGALELVLGGKVGGGVVRDGAAEAEVEAAFDGVTIRRTVTAAGRTRAWVNDESVSLAELRECGAKLVDIHGPRANQSLLEEGFQRETLDQFGGVGKGQYDAAYGEWASLRAELTALQAGGNAEDEADLLRYQIDELERAGLTEEDETVAERHAAAAHAEEIIEKGNEITDLLGGDRGVAELLVRLQPLFKAMARHLPEANEWAVEAEDATIKIQELSRTVADAVSRLDTGAEDLDALDDRLAVVNRMKRKYGGTVAEILAKLKAKKERLDVLENMDVRIAELETKIGKALRQVKAEGTALTKARESAAEKLSKAITRELHDLGFQKAKVFVRLEAIEPEPHGGDRVVFMFEPNPGESARPLAAIASSGETARVMLALKVVVSRVAETPKVSQTLVFDEIDANIGGEVGKIVGEKLRAVGKRHQVIAITHLPQSAVFGERHLVVSKNVSGGRTRTNILEVEGEDRVSEIARMLGGEKLTSVVKRHAEELLGLSRRVH